MMQFSANPRGHNFSNSAHVLFIHQTLISASSPERWKQSLFFFWTNQTFLRRSEILSFIIFIFPLLLSSLLFSLPSTHLGWRFSRYVTDEKVHGQIFAIHHFVHVRADSGRHHRPVEVRVILKKEGNNTTTLANKKPNISAYIAKTCRKNVSHTWCKKQRSGFTIEMSLSEFVSCFFLLWQKASQLANTERWKTDAAVFLIDVNARATCRILCPLQCGVTANLTSSWTENQNFCASEALSLNYSPFRAHVKPHVRRRELSREG